MSDLFDRITTTMLSSPLLGCALVAFCLAWPASGFSQDEEKEETAVEVDEAADQSERPTLEDEQGQQDEDLSGLKAEEFIENKDFKNVKLADEQIVRLRDLIKNTPENKEKRAEYMFNLSEMYWDKSKYYELEAFEKQDECYELRDQDKEQEAKQCKVRMEQMLDESERLREEAVDLYADIVSQYPNFEDLDKVYFYLGTNLQEIGEEEKAQKIFRRLIADFPNTDYVPNVLLSFGEYHFENDEVEEALEAYQKAAQYEDSSVYAYARYKAAWCYYNLEQKEKSLDLFLNVIDYAEANPEHPNSESLARQARKDIVRTYSHVGNPEKAVPFMKDLAKGSDTEWHEFAERLAIHYADQGNPLDSTAMYRQLIQTRDHSVKTIDYQYEIVRNQTTAKTYHKDAVKELVRLLKLVQMADQGKFEDIDEEEYAQTRDRVEKLARQWTTRYHREAQKTKNADLYAMAYHLYGQYLTAFPDSPKKYDLTFFYAELLYQLEQWEKAAQAYEEVLKIDSEGEYTEESVHAAVLSYFNFIDVSEEQTDLSDAETAQVDEDKDGEGEESEGPPEPEEIPEMYDRFLNACERYVEYAPEGEKIVDVKYKMARTYYDFNHFEEALEMFENIAHNHGDHELGVVSANLHLDTLNLLEDFDGLHEAVLAYLEERPVDDEEFIADAENLNVQIRFKKCTIHDEEEEWEKAAECFVEFYRDFPYEDEYIDKALYNAALDFERMRDLGKAIKVRVFLLQAAPDSELAPETLYNIGGNYHALAVYTEAAKFYEMFVDNFPEHEDAEDALANASEFRYGLGDYDKAIADYEKYLELFGDEKREEAAVAHFQIARIYQKEDRGDKAVDQYQRFLRNFEKDSDYDRILKAHAAIGEHYWEQGTDSDKQRALAEFKKILDIYESLDEETRSELTDGRDAAARAKFMHGEDIFEEMASIGVESSDEEELQERVKEKMEIAEDAQEIFEEVIQYRRPDWAIAALYRIGSQYQDFAETIRDSPVPDKLTPNQEEIYKGLLEDRASMVEDKAVDAYERALQVALDENWFNEYSREAEVELARLRPRDYRKPSEFRAEPTHFNSGFMRSAFITDVEEEDRLQDLGDDDTEGAAEDAAEDAVEETDVGKDGGDANTDPPGSI